MVVKVLFLYIPLPMFWALFDQQVMSILLFRCALGNDGNEHNVERFEKCGYIISLCTFA